MNAKGDLNEWCDRVGIEKPRYRTIVIGTIQNGDHYGCEVRLSLPGEEEERSAKAAGIKPGKASAEQEAARKLLGSLPPDYLAPPIRLDAKDIPVENGRVLLALAKLLSGNRLTPARRSLWETHYDCDGLLAHVYKKLEPNGEFLDCSEREKARQAMALVWRQFEHRVFQPGAMEALQELVNLLEQIRQETTPTPEELEEYAKNLQRILSEAGL